MTFCGTPLSHYPCREYLLGKFCLLSGSRRRPHRSSPPPWAKGTGTRRRRGGGAAGAGFARVSPQSGDRLRRDPPPSAKPRQRIKPFPMQKVPPSTGRTSGCFSSLSPRHWAADGWDCRSQPRVPSPHRGAEGVPSPRTAGYRYYRRSGCRWKGSAAYRRNSHQH